MCFHGLKTLLVYTAIPLQAVKYCYFDSDHSTVVYMNLLCNLNWWTLVDLVELSLRMFLCYFLCWNINTWGEFQGNLLMIVLCALILAFTSWKQCLILEILTMEVKRSMAIEYWNCFHAFLLLSVLLVYNFSLLKLGSHWVIIRFIINFTNIFVFTVLYFTVHGRALLEFVNVFFLSLAYL